MFWDKKPDHNQTIAKLIDSVRAIGVVVSELDVRMCSIEQKFKKKIKPPEEKEESIKDDGFDFLR